ncbi:hypothetical protein JTE90_001329 [Oedothorax gibbosus]|uniref:Uncharacterized protein n=1 Tax=Oedothorax gibbosus TaxID=931172 RepID=A0AAV6V0F4_9ARAC|nr:hypothetical protein JTE90_001329 [Oedothorax gibbosus]
MYSKRKSLPTETKTSVVQEKRKSLDVGNACEPKKTLQEPKRYPQLFAESTRTKFVSYNKNDHNNPSDLIGANFRGGTKLLNLRTIHKLKLPPPRYSNLKNILFLT